MGRIIVVEDNLTFSGYVCRLLKSKGFQAVSASTCNGANKLFAKMCEDDIVLADLRLNDGDGILLLDELRKQGKRNPYIIMTDYDEVPTAVRSMKSGAEDYIPKKLIEDNLFPLLKTLQKRTERHETPIHERQSAAFREIDHKIKLVAPTNMSVLVLGENGTGKEHIAEKIHTMSKRAGKPFVAVDCGLLSKELAASALFGHEKGAFTGADAKQKGYWEEADGGTLFLDEIGTMPHEIQSMLLRVLQENVYTPIGSGRERISDVRVISATNENMEQAIKEGRFREDLYHRLNEFEIRQPSLEECPEDIIPLAEFFRERFSKELKRTTQGFTEETKQRMLAYRWPGNVRELRNRVKRAVLVSESPMLDVDGLEITVCVCRNEETDTLAILPLKGEAFEKESIIRALKACNGHREQAAGMLNINPATLYRKMKKYGLK